jgi:hypothetical protein
MIRRIALTLSSMRVRAVTTQLRRVRFTTRSLMLMIALSAVILWRVHEWQRRPYYTQQSRFYESMQGLCNGQADERERRAKLCRERAGLRVRWDDSSEEAGNLKWCPYPNDRPSHDSWLELAEVWERAAAKSRDAAEWHSGMSRYWDGW